MVPLLWALLALQADPDAEVFEKKIRPLLVERCYSCHSVSSGKKKGGLLLDSKDAILKGGDSGPAAVPGDPDRSLLLRAVSYAAEELKMPPKGRLSAEQVADLSGWSAGAWRGPPRSRRRRRRPAPRPPGPSPGRSGPSGSPPSRT
jgi:hypothetical protein